MTDFFKSWLPQMIGYAELVDDERGIRRAWLDGDFAVTRIFYPGELLTQLFDDMHLDAMEQEVAIRLADNSALAQALREFIAGIRELDEWVKGRTPYPSNSEVLASSQWCRLHEKAKVTVLAAHEAGFSADDFDPK